MIGLHHRLRSMARSDGISLVGVEFTEDSAQNSDVMISRPDGVAENDLLVIVIHCGFMPTPPIGWTLVGFGAGILVYSKIAGASEPSSYTFFWAQTLTIHAFCLVFRGADTVVFGSSEMGLYSVNLASFDMPKKGLVLAYVYTTIQTIWGFPSGMVEIADDDSSYSDTKVISGEFDAGATGELTITITHPAYIYAASMGIYKDTGA